MRLTCEPRPPLVEADRFVGELEDKFEIAEWVSETMPWIPIEEQGEGFSTPGIYWNAEVSKLIMRTWMGTIAVNDGDWLIKDSAGNFTVLTDEAFNRTWREVQ